MGKLGLEEFEDPRAALFKRVEAEVHGLVAARDPSLAEGGPLPSVEKSRQLKQGDVTMQFARVCSKQKINPAKYTAELAEHLNAHFAARPGGLVTKAAGVGPYLNLFLNRAEVFKLVIATVLEQKEKFGRTAKWAGKKVVIEHTSNNPNSPLHIGNLRNVMVGAHSAELFKAVGATVEQRFYVNDLGAQIGLTALGYTKVYALLEPTMKIDHWIGSMYAIMNTLDQLQRAGIDIHETLAAFQAGEAAVEQFQAKAVAAAGGDEKRLAGTKEYLDIFADLFRREGYEKLLPTVVASLEGTPSIFKSAGELNLAYERQEEWAVKIFRKMVVDCLTGVQETLSIYNVRHDAFDFESELGWDGSNKKFLDIMKSSAYFVPQTQCNEEGKPQGAYMNMDMYIADQKLPTGKKGYQKDYPNFYVLRPDGSTLYTFRDVVYSFKKCHGADLVLNVIAFEQNLAQQKVALAMAMMNPELVGRQFHLGYEIVKLTTGKMSGRRGRYLLADDLYTQLKDVIREKMAAKYKEKGTVMPQEEFDAITHEVSTASMKYALLSASCATKINFDIAKVTDFEDASAPFILYNCTRLYSLLNKYEAGVKAGESGYLGLPALDQVDFSLLDDQREWEMLLDFVLPYASMLNDSTCPTIPAPPQLPTVATHRICEFLNFFVRALSSYYGPSGVRILPSQDGSGRGGGDAMLARIYLCQAFRQVIDNGLRLLMMEPLTRM